MSHSWSEEEVAWIRANLHLTKREMAPMISARFGFVCTLNMLKTVFTRQRIRCGRSGQFQAGGTPFNKGQRGVNGASPTAFQPGSRPHNWAPVGTERVIDGIAQVKIAEPHTWQSKHSLVWESIHGPLPPGHVVLFADGNRANCAPDNLILASRAEVMVMNKKRLITTNTEATRVGLTIAKVTLAMAERRKGARP